jgi:hypothetical protein
MCTIPDKMTIVETPIDNIERSPEISRTSADIDPNKPRPNVSFCDLVKGVSIPEHRISIIIYPGARRRYAERMPPNSINLPATSHHLLFRSCSTLVC